MTHITDIAIIGSGPAGCTAAVYAARALHNPILIRGPQPGGQLTITTEVENWPGIIDIQGPELTQTLEDHARHAGATILEDMVIAIEGEASPYTLRLESGETIEAKAVILAMGSQAKWLGIEGEDEYKGFGVSACATCDGFFFRNTDVAVIGGGNTALEEALFLTRFANHVHIIHRRDAFRGERILQNRVLEHPKITVHWNKAPTAVMGTKDGVKEVQALRLIDTQTQEQSLLSCSGVFVAIGHSPSSEIVAHLVQRDPHGYILTQGKGTKTDKEGFFAAGDITDPYYRQAVTSAGMGCMAALDAEKWLAEI